MTSIGRPSAVAPDGRLTLNEAADRLGLSYSGMYRYVREGIAHTQDDNGVITLAESTVDKLADKIGGRKRTGRRGRPRSESPKARAICVRVPPDVYARFEATIARANREDEEPTVAEWLASLGIHAANRAGV